MKKLLLITILVITQLNAQKKEKTFGFEKEDVYLSGTLGFNSSTSKSSFSWTEEEEKYSSETLTVIPSVGYFVDENLALELSVILSNNKTIEPVYYDDFGNYYPGYQEVKFNSAGFGLGLTYYFTPKNRFSFATGVGFSYVNSKYVVDSVENDPTKTFIIALSPGLNYFISEHFALRASIATLSYSSSNYENEDYEYSTTSNDFSVNLNFSDILFGLAYKF